MLRRFQLLLDGRLRVRVRLSREEIDAGAELVLRAARCGAERRAPFEPSDEGPRAAEAYLDVRELPPPSGADDEWVLHVSVAGGEPRRLEAKKGAGGREARIAGGPEGLFRMRAKVDDDGVAFVRCRLLPAHAEVERVEIANDSIAIEGRARPGDLRLLATSRRDRAERTWPVAAAPDGRFSARLISADLVREGPGEVWDLRLQAGEDRLRLGAHFDWVLDKSAVAPYPARPAIVGDCARRLRPYYTVENRLSLRSSPMPLAEAREFAARTAAPLQPAPPARRRRPTRKRPGPRRRVELAAMKSVQAVALGILRLAIGRRAPRGERSTDRVHVLLMNAYGMGGTIRTSLNVAEQLARTHEVELISVIRRRERPLFEFPEGITVSTVDDRRRAVQAEDGWLTRRLRKLPSVLVPPEDFAFSASSLWSDVQLIRKLRSLESGVLITTRPAFNLVSAKLTPARIVAIGEEHMNLNAHPPALIRQIGRHYRRLDAIVARTHDDRRNYAEALAGARTRAVRITNSLPRLAGDPQPERERIVIAAGRLTWQKGFDLLIDAFGIVAQKHPDWKLRIYGDGVRHRRLRRRILRQDVYNNVFLMGATRRLGELMSRASLFALSSRYEGFGMVIVEAMSKGLPVVSFDCEHGPGEIIDHGVDGLLVEPENVEALAQSLIALIEDEERRRAMSAAALEKAHQFDVETIGSHWERLFDELETTTATRHDDRASEPAHA